MPAMESFFLLLHKFFAWISEWCKKWAGQLSHNKLKKQAIHWTEEQFVACIQTQYLKPKARDLYRAYTKRELSGMDLSIALGWLCTHGKGEGESIDLLASYLNRELSTLALQELLLTHIIQRSGAFTRT